MRRNQSDCSISNLDQSEGRILYHVTWPRGGVFWRSGTELVWVLVSLGQHGNEATGSGVGFLRLTAVWSQPYYAACVNVSRNDRAMFFSARALLALWKLLNKKHFLWRWYCGRKQIEMWFIGVCTLMVNEYASQLFSQTFFRIVSACWAASLRKFLKGKSDAYK